MHGCWRLTTSRAVHFGDRELGRGGAGIPVDDAPLDGPSGRLRSSPTCAGLTDDPGTAVAIVLPERLQPNLRWLRSRRALAIKRCLLFEPHVILSSVPFQA